MLQTAGKHPTLLYLCCTGGKMENIDTARLVYDSLEWNIAVCGKSRNHRDPKKNTMDILNLVDELLTFPQVDSYRIVIYGFSGQGAQALSIALSFPLLFGGVITQCAHDALIRDIDRENVPGLPVVLLTREKDWNRGRNEKIKVLLDRLGANAKLIVTPGVHRIGDAKELLFLCREITKLWQN